MPATDRQETVLNILRNLRDLDGLKRLFWEELNYERENRPLSPRQWPESARQPLAEDPILFATGGEDNAFHVVYCRLESDALLRGHERPVVNRLTREHPYALFVFSNKGRTDWHFLNVKYDEDAEKRRLLRRITVRPGLPAATRAAQAGDGLRTAAERLRMLDLVDGVDRVDGELSPLTIQSAHDTAFDVEKVTKDFYREIANWYFWALKHVTFPKDAPKEQDGRDHISVIRLITRLIFCWFMREKGLIPDVLFDETKLAGMLNGFAPGEARNKYSVFYRAILQNLFFATLNTEMDQRGWRRADQNFMAHSLYRHKECFRDPKAGLEWFKDIPFLNGGLFECLDRDFGLPAATSAAQAGETAKPRYLRIDGFSDRDDSRPTVPDFLFFGSEQDVNLSEDYGNKKFKSVRVRGLIDTLNRYKFTIEENTPFDQEVALDPELCGKVFENLLAAYNPETGTTARKATGSFYTPREIVDYMVDESLVAYLRGRLVDGVGKADEEKADRMDARLRTLLSYEGETPEFGEEETASLIDAIDELKALDPAVGSGAFPMGILHKLVLVLGKLDPNNERWKTKQITKLDDATMREDAERLFRENYDDYGRKLYLIENCIYGVDIQPIAVQIAKMRFFISLIVDQKVNPKADNLGVRALPNLETKFVAANTLIGIERPVQMMLRNPDIDKKEAELRKVRERHFTARTLKSKAKCREDDKRLRAEIAELLKSDGWNDTTAKQLAAWDPYDQNASADFFDSEWMFGVKEGFDVVIGNPPYGAYIPGKQLIVLKTKLTDTKNTNSAAIFVDFAKNKIIKSSGVLSFIVPKSLLFSEKWLSLAKALAPKTTALVDVEQAFENVLLEQVVFVYNSLKTEHTYTAQKFVKQSFVRTTSIPVIFLEQFGTWLCDVTVEEISIACKMVDGATFFSDISQTIRGLPLQRALENDGTFPVIGGKQIQPYTINGVKGYLPRSVLQKTKRKWSLLLNPKIVSQNIVSHIANPAPHIKIISAPDLEGTILSVDTVNNTYLTRNDFDLRFLVALLNSNLLSWFAYRFVYAGAIRTMHFDEYYVGKLPIPNKCEPMQSLLTEFVSCILSAKAADPAADTSALEREIDQQVYALYGLTAEEIAVVEGATPGKGTESEQRGHCGREGWES